MLLQFYLLRKASGRITVSPSHVKLNLAVMTRLLRLSLGGIGQFLIATSSWVGLVRIMSEFGSEALAGYTIGVRIIIFSILPSWGMSGAAATLVGQNLGAQKPDRAERAVWITAIINTVFLGLVAIVFIFFSEFLVRLFTSEPAVVATGADCLRYISYGYLFYAFGMVMTQAFNGAGGPDP